MRSIFIIFFLVITAAVIHAEGQVSLREGTFDKYPNGTAIEFKSNIFMPAKSERLNICWKEIGFSRTIVCDLKFTSSDYDRLIESGRTYSIKGVYVNPYGSGASLRYPVKIDAYITLEQDNPLSLECGFYLSDNFSHITFNEFQKSCDNILKLVFPPPRKL